MKESSKAALLSAFVCPGVGHLYLKRMAVGLGLLSASLWALYVLLSNAISRALVISDKIVSGEVAPDVIAIRELIAQQPIGSDAQLINLATTVLIAAWLIGIVDSYRSGRIEEKDRYQNQKNDAIK